MTSLFRYSSGPNVLCNLYLYSYAGQLRGGSAGTIKNGQSRETDNIRYTRRRKTKQKHNTIWVGHHNTQTNTNNLNKAWTLLQTTRGKDELNNVNKTWTLLQTTRGKDELNIVFYAEILTNITTRNSERKDT